jgi:diguanylate cyclase (GGDEF)-like protein
MTMAGSTVQRQRSQRARALIVGSGELLRELAASMRKLVPAVSEIESLYEAIAEVGLSSAREPVSAVIVSADCEGFELREVVESFRAVDPAVPLILAVRRGQEDLVAEAIAEDFEHSLVLPVDAAELLPILGEVGLVELRRETQRDATPAARPTGTARAADGRAVDAHQPAQGRAPSTPDHHDGERNVVELVIEDAIAGASRAKAPAHDPIETDHLRAPVQRAKDALREQAREQAKDRGREPSNDGRAGRHPRTHFVMPAPRPAPAREGPPGDIDLVRAVLENSDLQAAALRVLRHHLGTADVRFVPALRPGEEETVKLERRGLREAVVHVGSRSFGSLLSATLEEATLAAWATWLSHWLELEESHRELRRFAWTDELTGAGNRRAFETVLREAMAHALAERRTISLMYLDIDDFKRYNDDFGHHAGDEVLRETAELLRTCVRAGDHVFRIGGDEFVVVFCDASGPRKGGGGAPESVEAIVARFQRAIGELRLPQLGREGPGTITVSAGVAVFPWEGHDAETLINRADQRALESKRNGKNQITLGPGASAGGGLPS